MRNPETLTLSQRIAARTLRLFTAAVLGFLVAPVLIVIPLSFNDSNYFSYPMTGFTTGWYESIFAAPEWRRAIVNSFAIGLGATTIATVLGTMAAMGISRPSFPLRGLLVPILISPMIIPI